jgi:hypothetical protein
MATTFQNLITRARRRLLELSPRFWSDAELMEHAIEGAQDLWKAVKSVNQHYLATINATSVSLSASTATLTGVPADVAIMLGIEPRTPSSYRDVFFRPLNYFDPKFQAARTVPAQDPTGMVIYYDLTGAGAPVAAPTVHVAPMITSDMLLRFSYIPTLDAATITTASVNPIPGETDHALTCWIIAKARAKEREDRTPDPVYMGMYDADKLELKHSVLPKRQEDEPEIVAANFEQEWE